MMAYWRCNTLTVLVLTALLLLGCGATDKQLPALSSEQIEANKRIVRQLSESVWNEAKFAGLEQLLAPDVRFHFRGEAPSVGPEGVRNQVESHRVAIRVRLIGTHTGDDWFGLAATGKSIDVTEMMFFRLHDGKVVEV